MCGTAASNLACEVNAEPRFRCASAYLGLSWIAVWYCSTASSNLPSFCKAEPESKCGFAPSGTSATTHAVRCTSGTERCVCQNQSAPSGTTNTPTHFKPCQAQPGSMPPSDTAVVPPASPSD